MPLKNKKLFARREMAWAPMYAMVKYKNIMRAISTNRSLVATGLAVCCALAAASYARAEAVDANDPLGGEVAQLVQWHSGTSAANDFCGAREETLFYVRHPRMYAVFLVMHGAPGVAEDEVDASLTSFDSLDGPHGSAHGL